MAASSNHVITYNTPCAACKFLRRKCMPGCIFAPYFPPEEPQKFANVHKIFGASNITKQLNELLPHQREDAVNSLAYEAEARVRDPVYGCAGAISFLQMQVAQLQKEVDTAKANLMRYASCCQNISTDYIGQVPRQMRPVELMMDTRRGGFSYYQAPASTFSFSWNKDSNTSSVEGGAARQG